MHTRHTQRTAEWGHWGITFMDVQPDPTKNFGVIVATLSFPVGARGPIDGPNREHYSAAIANWVSDGVLPREAVFIDRR